MAVEYLGPLEEEPEEGIEYLGPLDKELDIGTAYPIVNWAKEESERQAEWIAEGAKGTAREIAKETEEMFGPILKGEFHLPTALVETVKGLSLGMLGFADEQITRLSTELQMLAGRGEIDWSEVDKAGKIREQLYHFEPSDPLAAAAISFVAAVPLGIEKAAEVLSDQFDNVNIKAAIQTAGWFGSLGAFGKVFQTLKAPLKPKVKPKIPVGAKEFEAFMREEAVVKAGREAKAAVLRAARKRKLPPEFMKELEKVEPFERAPVEVEAPVRLRKAWQAVKAREPKEVIYKPRRKKIPIEELKEPSEAIVTQINKEMPGNQLKYDAEWQPTPKHIIRYQFTPQAGIAKGATFYVDKLDLKSVKSKLAQKIEEFRPKKPKITLPEPKIKPPVKEKVEKVVEPIPKVEIPKELPKSKGHVGFTDKWEYFTTEEGTLYRAPKSNALDVNGIRVGARFESTVAGANAVLEQVGLKPIPKEIVKPIPKPKEVKEPVIARIEARQVEMDVKYAPVVGRRVKAEGIEWEFIKTNDLGIPYFSKVIKGKVQKKRFTLSEYRKDWLDKELGKVEPTKATKALEVEYRKLKDDFMSYKFDIKSPKMKRLIEVEKIVKPLIPVPKVPPKPEAMVETFGFQRAYEWLDDVKKGREIKVREKVKKIRQDYLTPVEGNPLDKGAVAFLKSEKYPDYIKEMPAIGELSPKEIFRYDPVAKTLIATIETKGGELKPAIRQSGYHALKQFADSFEGARDVSKLGPSWTDPTRMIQELDQGFWGGMAQKHILWPSRMTTLSKLRFQDMRKVELNNIAEKYDIKSGKKARAVGDIIEYVNTERAKLPAEWLLKLPEIQSFLKKFKPEVKAQLVEASKDLRIFADKLLDAQNIARKARKQKEIPYRVFYRPWIMETNLWSKLIGQKIRPEEIMERPEMPDFIFPNQPFNPRAEARTGLMAKYPKERNIVRLMNDYIDTAGKDIFDTNVVHNNKIHAAVLKSKGLENAADGINRWTSEVFAGVDPRLTKWAKEVMPPVGRKAMLKIRRNLTRAVFPLNWTWNLFIQTSSAGITYARYGTKANVAGLRYLFSPKMHRAVKENAYSHIIKSRWGGKAHYQDIQNSISKNKRLEARPIEKAEDFLNYLTSSIESGLTGHAVAAAEYHGRVKFGLKGRQLWEYASEGGSKTQSMYNFGDIPGMLRAKEVGAVTPFQTFSFEVFNTIREMNIPGLRKFIGKTGLYETLSADSVAGKALMSNRLKMLARWTAAIIVTDAVGETAIGRKPWVVSSFIPFIGYLVGGYAGRGPVPHQYIQDAKAGIRDVLVYGDFGKLRKWLLRYQIIAGVQINRMMDGMEAVAKGGRVTDVRERTLFRIPPEEYLKAVAMGPYRTEEGKKYIKKRKEARSILKKMTLRRAHQTIK